MIFANLHGRNKPSYFAIGMGLALFTVQPTLWASTATSFAACGGGPQNLNVSSGSSTPGAGVQVTAPGPDPTCLSQTFADFGVLKVFDRSGATTNVTSSASSTFTIAFSLSDPAKPANTHITLTIPISYSVNVAAGPGPGSAGSTNAGFQLFFGGSSTLVGADSTSNIFGGNVCANPVNALPACDGLYQGIASAAIDAVINSTMGLNQFTLTLSGHATNGNLDALHTVLIGGATNLPPGTSFAYDAGVTGNPLNLTVPVTGLRFVPVAPCRMVDTRGVAGALGGPFLAAAAARSFSLTQSNCGVPASVLAYSLNATVVPRGPLGYLTIWPAGAAQPSVSTLNSMDGRIKANAALIPAGSGGSVSVFATNATDLILDVNGYFVDAAANPQSLAFYPLTPCRVVDTRNPAGPVGGPVLGAGVPRSFSVLAASCGIPANAQAYSLNATVAPSGPLGYLTLWPTGQGQPFVSTLNAPTGAVVANAAIVPAGVNGTISAFATSQTHLVLDINGYFAAPGAANAQRYFTVTPCRLVDTRLAAGEFGGPVLAANQSRDYRLPLANCGLPTAATAFSLNATVVPTAALGYLTLWPSASAQPPVSTLNAPDDPIVANAAIVPAGPAGSVSSFVTNATHLILDTNGYFAP